MIVMFLRSTPVGVRGEMTKWLLEPYPGVFIGNLNARVRDLLWDKCCNHKKVTGVLQVWNTNTEQGYFMRGYGNLKCEIVDFDGLQLIMKLKKDLLT